MLHRTGKRCSAGGDLGETLTSIVKDAGAHMSEELKDASLQLPKAMVWATVLNGVLGITMLITFWFVLEYFGRCTLLKTTQFLHHRPGGSAER